MEKPNQDLCQEKLSEAEARQKALAFLQRNYQAIHMLRSYRQILNLVDDDDHLSKDLGAQLIQLEGMIEEKSSGELKCHESEYALCEIKDYSQVFAHYGDFFKELPLAEVVEAIRGFYFKFTVDGYQFECVDLDGGRSREYFDSKNQMGKREFIQRFGNRYRHSLEPPSGFTAFITNTGERYIIEEMVSYNYPRD